MYKFEQCTGLEQCWCLIKCVLLIMACPECPVLCHDSVAETTSKCCLCGETFTGYGHNAHPVRDEGVACDACNGAIVLPQRFRKWAA